MCPKYANEIANSVDPESDLGLHCLHRNFMVNACILAKVIKQNMPKYYA